MYNFKPGGIRHRKDDLGGRPKSDADYSTKGRFDKKPRHDARGGNRQSDRGGDRGGREMQLFQATCTTCGKSCEVPFRPDGTKPVLCRDCFAQKNASPERTFGRDDRSERRPDSRPERSFDTVRPSAAPAVDIAPLTRQISSLESKVSQLLEMVTALQQSHATHTTKEVVIEVAKVAAVPKPKKAEQVKSTPVLKPKKVEAVKIAPPAKVKKEVVVKAPAKKVVKKAVTKAAVKVAKKAVKKVTKK
jgi:CxxC-x17-CxxC domain-containing protein